MNRELEKLKTIKNFNFVIGNFIFKAIEINDIVKKKPKVFFYFYYFLKRKREKRRSKSLPQVD